MARRAGGSGSQKAAFCSETISQWSYHSTSKTHVSTLQLRVERSGASSSRAVLQPTQSVAFHDGAFEQATGRLCSRSPALKADDDCVGNPMWRVIYQRGPKQLGVDVSG